MLLPSVAVFQQHAHDGTVLTNPVVHYDRTQPSFQCNVLHHRGLHGIPWPQQLYRRWPLGRGFERYYGFLGGGTHQYYPELVYDNHTVEAGKTPEEGYHLTEDLVDHAIGFIAGAKQVAPDKPFFLYFCPGGERTSGTHLFSKTQRRSRKPHDNPKRHFSEAIADKYISWIGQQKAIAPGKPRIRYQPGILAQRTKRNSTRGCKRSLLASLNILMLRLPESSMRWRR